MNITKGTGTRRLASRLNKISKGDRIADKAFNPYANGVTRFSLIFWDVVKQHIDISKFTKAEMTYSTEQHYKFTLTHINGFKLVFHGVSSGYHGEGSRGTHKILTECGFSNPDRVFQRDYEQFVMRKTAK